MTEQEIVDIVCNWRGNFLPTFQTMVRSLIPTVVQQILGAFARPPKWMYMTGTFTLTADTNTKDMPGDFAQLIQLWTASGGIIRIRTVGDFDRIFPDPDNAGTPTDCCLIGDRRVKFNYKPSSDLTINRRYRKKFEASLALFLIPIAFHYVIVHGIKAELDSKLTSLFINGVNQVLAHSIESVDDDPAFLIDHRDRNLMIARGNTLR